MKKFLFYLSISYLGFLCLVVIVSFIRTEFFGVGLLVMPSVDDIFSAPSAAHWLGTDSLGRDLWTRMLLGARVSLLTGLVGSAFAVGLGLVLGVLSGWCGGIADRLLMRLTDIIYSVPSFALVAVLCLFFQQVFADVQSSMRSTWILILVLGLTHWMNTMRVIRGQVHQVKTEAFVEAAHALGGSNLHILWVHILPSLRSTLFVLLALQIPNSILYESFMSFIGMGVQSPETSWGILVSEGWKSLSLYPHVMLAPSLAIFLTVFSVHRALGYFQGESNLRKWTL